MKSRWEKPQVSHSAANSYWGLLRMAKYQIDEIASYNEYREKRSWRLRDMEKLQDVI